MPDRPKKQPGQQSGLQTLDRAFAVLSSVASRANAGAKLAEVAEDCGLNRATTHRLLQALVVNGLLERDRNGSRYFVGFKLVHLSELALRRFGLEAATLAARRRIAEATGDTVFLTTRMGTRMVCSARSEGSFPVKVLTLDVGAMRPLGVGAGGLAILAFLDDVEMNRIVGVVSDQYPAFNLDAARVVQLCREARARGYSIDADTVLHGVTGVGAPLRSADGAVVASLSVAAVSQRMTDERIQSIGKMLQDEARNLSQELEMMAAGSGRAVDADKS
ncbi:IclR family transcriptional regulator [Geminicoccaceae bacterium 1502E]|nr:IclR family transcriptional regulator [Geminicoccaceae bacterium 1502E]